jgi:uncharacterized protein with GYD domain
MPTYVSLLNWTDQGVGNFKDTVDRFEAARGAMGAFGVTFKDIYWTVGQHDMVTIVEAPDDETATAALLSIAAQGNSRSTTLRGFSADEMRAVIAKTG